MRIYLLLNQPYPHGYALTKRFHLYAKGFRESGHSVKMIIPKATETDNKLNNASTSGVFEEIPFEYSCNCTTRSVSFLTRRYQDTIGFIKAGFICFNEKPDIVITSSFSFLFFLYLRLILILTSTKLIREKNEIDYMNNDYLSSGKRIKLRLTNNVFHGFLVISQNLLEYLKNDLNIRKEAVIIPILIEDFKKQQKFTIAKTIVYTGTYLERKDGILTIINAFAEINQKYPDYKLVLTGRPEKSKDYNEIKRIISSKGLEKQIHFTGYLSEQNLHSLLLSANMLILAKPDNRQNKYNFPTKIGEYLISGRPVISTKVGVIGDIMEDNENIVFADFEITSISQKVEHIINNSKLANTIGENGRQYALGSFNYLTHAQKMVAYFETLRK